MTSEINVPDFCLKIIVFIFLFSDLKNMEAISEALSLANHDFSLSLYTVCTKLLKIITYK